MVSHEDAVSHETAVSHGTAVSRETAVLCIAPGEFGLFDRLHVPWSSLVSVRYFQ